MDVRPDEDLLIEYAFYPNHTTRRKTVRKTGKHVEYLTAAKGLKPPVRGGCPAWRGGVVAELQPTSDETSSNDRLGKACPLSFHYGVAHSSGASLVRGFFRNWPRSSFPDAVREAYLRPGKKDMKVEPIITDRRPTQNTKVSFTSGKNIDSPDTHPNTPSAIMIAPTTKMTRPTPNLPAFVIVSLDWEVCAIETD